MIKKSLALILSLLFALGLSACGGSDDDSIPKKDNTAVTTDGTNPAKPVSDSNEHNTPAAAPSASTPTEDSGE